MIYKKQYGHPFDTESVVGSFVPAMETIPYLTREPDGFSYAMDPRISCMAWVKTSAASTSAAGCTRANAAMTPTIPKTNPHCTALTTS